MCCIILLLMVTSGFLGAGSFFWYSLVGVIRAPDASRSWPVTEGRVTDTNIEFSRIPVPQSGFAERHFTIIEYVYSVGDVEYSSKQKFRKGKRSAAQEAVAAFLDSRPLAVYYNPRNPDISLLEPGGASFGWAWLWRILLGTLSSLIGLLLIVSAFGTIFDNNQNRGNN